MIKRPTWFLLVIFALVIGAYFVIKNRTPAESSASTPTALGSNFLVTQSDGTLKNILITDDQNRTVEIQRDSSGTWMVEQPTFGAADQALAEAAATQVSSLRIVTTLGNQLNLADAGLVSPSSTIELTFTNGLKHIIQVGSLTPTNSGYYVLYDTGNIFVVSQSGIDALLKLLVAPPYAATETPIPIVEATVTATNENITPSP